MNPLKQKGDLAELKVATDIVQQGYRIAIPFGEDWDADLIVEREGQLERVQVKHVCSDGVFIEIKCFSQTVQAGRIRVIKAYTSKSIDWLAAWDATTDTCVYVAAAELGTGRRTITLRYAPAGNGQRRGVRMAADFKMLR